MQIGMIGLGWVAVSGEGRRTFQAAIDETLPAPVLSAVRYARYARCGSRGEADFANRLQSAMRHAFGGPLEKVCGSSPQET